MPHFTTVFYTIRQVSEFWYHLYNIPNSQFLKNIRKSLNHKNINQLNYISGFPPFYFDRPMFLPLGSELGPTDFRITAFGTGGQFFGQPQEEAIVQTTAAAAIGPTAFNKEPIIRKEFAETWIFNNITKYKKRKFHNYLI